MTQSPEHSSSPASAAPRFTVHPGPDRPSPGNSPPFLPPWLQPVVPFHRLVRVQPRYRWWRPLTELAVFMISLSLIWLVLIGVASGLLSGQELGSDLSDPVHLAFVLLSLAAMIPAVWLAVRIGGGRRFATVLAVGRFRLFLLARFSLLSVVIVGVSFAVVAFYPRAGNDLVAMAAPAAISYAVIVLALVPLQAGAEEIVFRGFLPQLIGAWIRPFVAGALVPVLLFTLGHTYSPLGLATVAILGLAMAVVTWKTGGLEAAIAYHVLNNFAALLQVPLGLADANASDVGLTSFALSTVAVLAYVATVWWWTDHAGPAMRWRERSETGREAATVRTSTNTTGAAGGG